ncbi:MAG TPA: SLC45 family MFS transporter [Anaerolineae bacterium]|nr:SLC45 family MFS transporter [Anaerolineae bacterium]
MKKATPLNLIGVNAYWMGLSFMWNSLHVIMLPAIMLNFVADQQKNTALGLMSFLGLLLAMVVQPLSGAISDRWVSRFGRRRPLILIGTAFDLLFLGIMTMAGGVPALALGYFGLQLASNIAHGPAQGLMHDLIPSESMGLASGIKNFFDMGGLVISSLWVARILDPQNPLTAYAAVAALLVAGALVTLIFSREQSSLEMSKPVSFRTQLREILRIDFRGHRDYGRLIAVRLLFLTGIYGVQSFAQYFIKDTLQTDDAVKLTGDLMAIIVLSLIAFSLVAGYLCDRFGRKPMHVIAAILAALGSLLMTTAHSAGAVLGFGSLIGAGIGIFLSANWALANDLAPLSEAGKFLGLTNLATAGAGALSRLNGPMLDLVNNAWPGRYLGYSVLFVTTAVLALASLILLRRVPDPTRKQA